MITTQNNPKYNQSPTNYSAFASISTIGPDEIKPFKDVAEQSEMRAFAEIIDKLICVRKDLNDAEIMVVRGEL
jgi:hypothetical protein